MHWWPTPIAYTLSLCAAPKIRSIQSWTNIGALRPILCLHCHHGGVLYHDSRDIRYRRNQSPLDSPQAVNRLLSLVDRDRSADDSLCEVDILSVRIRVNELQRTLIISIPAVTLTVQTIAVRFLISE